MQGHGPGMPPRRRGDQFTDIGKAGAPGERSPNSALLIEEGGEARLHPQPRRDAVPADPVIELLVPMIDAALLVAQRHACASRRVDGLLHRVRRTAYPHRQCDRNWRSACPTAPDAAQRMLTDLVAAEPDGALGR